MNKNNFYILMGDGRCVRQQEEKENGDMGIYIYVVCMRYLLSFLISQSIKDSFCAAVNKVSCVLKGYLLTDVFFVNKFIWCAL